MKIHFVFNGLDDAARSDLEQYWTHKKMPRLNKLLAPYPPDRRDVWLTVYRRPKGPLPEWYEARAVVQLPTGTLAAQADEKAPEDVLDQVADALAAKIRRHNEQVRKDLVFKRKAGRRADLNAVGPLLQGDVENGRRAEFFRLLRPLLRFLRDHAARELTILELEGPLHRREVTADDVLDEVMTRAWQNFRQRPSHVPLDLWLTSLLHEVLDRWVRQEPRPHVSLEERAEEAQPGEVPPMEEKQEKQEKEWWDELDPFEQTALLEDLLPGREEEDPWERLEAEERWQRLAALLGELPAVRRQAFLLSALEDYTPAEIAMVQGRSENEVKADIEAARRTLRERLSAGGQVQQAGKKPAASGAAGREGH